MDIDKVQLRCIQEMYQLMADILLMVNILAYSCREYWVWGEADTSMNKISRIEQ